MGPSKVQFYRSPIELEPSSSLRTRLLITNDGSPTLEVFDPIRGEFGESMHSRQGALSESIFVYGEATRALIERSQIPRALSVGLGLGYNELLFAAEALKAQLPVEKCQLFSFEIHEELRSAFIDVMTQASLKPISSVILAALQLIALEYQLPSRKILDFLKEAYELKRFQIHGDFLNWADISQKFNLIFFDPYSDKSNPELWSDQIIDRLLDQQTDDFCLWSTYAAKGSLYRKLSEAGFSEGGKRKGFGLKRNSTFSIRDPRASPSTDESKL